MGLPYGPIYFIPPGLIRRMLSHPIVTILGPADIEDAFIVGQEHIHHPWAIFDMVGHHK